MAAKRVAQSTINWASIAERVPPEQKQFYLAFKAKSDTSLRKVVSLPEQPPKIDWAYYKTKVPLPAMVDEFQKKYEAYKIPLPDDSAALSQIAAAEKEVTEIVKKFKEESVQNISKFEAELKKCESRIPLQHMTMEEFSYAYPEEAIDPVNNPTFWPHDEDHKLGPEGNVEKEHH